MLSDVCHEFCSETQNKSDEDIQVHLPQLKKEIDHYRDVDRVINYHPHLLQMLDKTIEQYEKKEINGERLWFVVAKVVGFLDGPPELPHEALFKECGFTPS